MKIDFADGKYRIETDRYNWAFKEFKGIDKNGKQMFDTWGYWGTIDQLAKNLPDHFLRRSEDLSKQAMDEYRSIIADLQGAVAEAKGRLSEQLGGFEEIIER